MKTKYKIKCTRCIEAPTVNLYEPVKLKDQHTEYCPNCATELAYVDGDNYVFSDNETYEEALLNTELLGDRKYFIVDDMSVEILFHNDRALDVTLPNFIELKISETEPGARGDTATNVMKPAILENGYELNVPIFINEGDLIRIDTRSGEYADRVVKG